VARYEAIGSGACHSQVRWPPWRLRPSRRPWATTSRAAGAVTTKVQDALSIGWSLTGNQVAATSGWPATMAPLSVWMNPASMVKPGTSTISWVMGTPS
jgi:hypothetical protein